MLLVRCETAARQKRADVSNCIAAGPLTSNLLYPCIDELDSPLHVSALRQAQAQAAPDGESPDWPVVRTVIVAIGQLRGGAAAGCSWLQLAAGAAARVNCARPSWRTGGAAGRAAMHALLMLAVNASK